MRWAVILDVRGRAVVNVEAETWEEACALGAQVDPWDYSDSLEIVSVDADSAEREE